MADKKTPNKAQDNAENREDRLKAALKANLMRRKVQSRGRAQMAQAAHAPNDNEPGNSGQDKDA